MHRLYVHSRHDLSERPVISSFDACISQAEDLREMAKTCQEDGCSVEAVSNLLDQLKSKKKELEVSAVFFCYLLDLGREQ